MVEAPWFKLRVPTEAKRVKLGTAMFNWKVVVTVCPPDVPVIVTVLVPTGAEAPILRLSVLLEFVGLGENEAVTPLGSPETERFTPPVKPYWEPTYT